MLALCRNCLARSYGERRPPDPRRCSRCGSTALVVFSSWGVVGRIAPSGQRKPPTQPERAATRTLHAYRATG